MKKKSCKEYIINRIVFKFLEKFNFVNILPDQLYLRMMFKCRMGYRLHLKKPVTFSEKLQWLKLYNRKDIYTTMVDKYRVKDYVANILGEEYIIPTLGVFKKFEEIDFSKLPKQFVIKCNHDSGGLIIVRDKSKVEYESMQRIISETMHNNYYLHGREWPYKNIDRRIIVEKYMEDNSGVSLRDYKFYCFNGEPKFLYLSEGLENHETAKISFVTLDWTLAEFYRKDYQTFTELPEKPINFQKMIDSARLLAKSIPFVRIDFYEINGHMYFGEITFFPTSGMAKFYPEQYDELLGHMIQLPL